MFGFVLELKFQQITLNNLKYQGKYKIEKNNKNVYC